MPSRPVPVDRIVDLTDAGRGLSAAEAAARQGAFGFNDIIVAPPSTWLDLVRNTARDPMIWFLVSVSALFAILGDHAEAVVLALAIAPLVGMDSYLHRRTQASTQGLASRLAAQARVIRDGAPATLPARDVVPGDLVEMGPGEAFPADGLLVSATEAQADESSLTGEAYPVRKYAIPPSARPPRSADHDHWVFAGTRLLTGTARMRVLHTGAETLYGEIVRSAVSGGNGPTPLQAAIGRLVGTMLAAAVLACVTVAAIRLWQGHGLFDAFLSAVTLAVAALPEEFPVVFTFFLGVGVYRLARRQALVRRAVTVESIGRVSTICTDKTGTLTEGRLTAAHAWTPDGTAPEALARWAAIAARPDSGDPLDIALGGLADTGAIERLQGFAFTEARRRETAIIRSAGGPLQAVVKGAPETVFEMCGATPATLERARAEVAAFAAGGHKVIAIASKAIDGTAAPAVEPEQGYVLRGVVALEDPVRDGVADAVADCGRAGIRVIMVTGDHPATAEAIGREIGLRGGRPVVALAQALEADGAGSGAALARGVDIVARATPVQKLALVQALRQAGEIVAVTGDGVNDVPALQAADIGIAMGERGTQGARETAAIVLLDDNFRTIVQAIAEGQQLLRNLQLAFAYLLMIHVPLVVSAAVIPLADHPLLYLPVHIVWLELIIHPTALLVFQDLPASDRLMQAGRAHPPHFFDRSTWLAIGGSGLILSAAIFFGFEHALGPGDDIAHARSLGISALIGAGAAITAVLSGLKSRASWIVTGGGIGSLVLFMQVPPLAAIVHLQPLHWPDWAFAGATGLGAGVLALLVRATLRR